MLKLDEKEYNLDNLLGINFDLLKEILLKLSKSDNDILIEINNIKNTNISRDNKISELEKKITELNNSINNINNTIKEKSKDNALKEEKNINEINYKEIPKEILNEKIDTEKIIQSAKSEFDANLISMEKINNLFISKEDIKNIDEINPNIEKDININNDLTNMKEQTLTNKKEIKEKIYDKNKTSHKSSSFYNINPRTLQKYYTEINIPQMNNNPLLTPKINTNNESLSNIFHEINEIKDHINFVEKNLIKKNNETLRISKELLSKYNMQTMSELNSIKSDINKLNTNQKQLDKALSFLAQKLEDKSSINIQKSNLPEIIQIYNNNEDEENNNKIQMTKTFFDSINKRFEYNNERYLKLFEENHKIKQDINNIKGLYDNLNRQIDLVKNDTEDINDDIKRIKEKIKELNSNTKNKEKIDTNDFLTMNNLEEINKYIDKKINELIEQMLEIKDEPNKKEVKVENNMNKKDKALLKIFNKRLNEFNEKLSFMDEDSIKNRKKINSRLKEIEGVFNTIEKINKTLKEKSDKKDLNSIYAINKKNLDEINNMKLTMEELSLSQEKLREAVPNFNKRLEKLTYEFIKFKENLDLDMPKGDFQIVRKEYNTKVEEHNKIEFNEEKVKYIMAPLAEEVKKVIEDTKIINTKIKSINEENKSFVKKKYVENIENNFNDKINSIENLLDLLDSKYLKNKEFQKILKTLDIQIKQLQGNNNNSNNNSVLKQEGDNWLLAKQPIKCFNCASCEANVSNTLQQNEYLPWSKYHGQYRIGQGFSKLLQKLENKEDKDKDKDNNKIQEKNKIFNNSYDNNEITDNNFFIIKNNQISNIKKIKYFEDKPSFSNLRKNKLPRLVENLKRKQKSTDYIPISDDEKEEVIDIVEHSPQILKITKLKNDDIINPNILDINNLKNKTGRNSQNKKINLNRVQSLPLY